MIKIFFSGLIVLNISLFAKGTEDITKEAIVKLIQKNNLLEKRLNRLEIKFNFLFNKNQKKVSSAIKNTGIANKLFFVSKGKSFIRSKPTPSARIVAIATHDNRYKIDDFKCYKAGLIFWGKNKKGWIYISNPSYGSLVDDNGNKLSLAFEKWCRNE